MARKRGSRDIVSVEYSHFKNLSFPCDLYAPQLFDPCRKATAMSELRGLDIYRGIQECWAELAPCHSSSIYCGHRGIYNHYSDIVFLYLILYAEGYKINLFTAPRTHLLNDLKSYIKKGFVSSKERSPSLLSEVLTM